ncbi:Extracellular calcium-sensing receptor [Varanus komodoensis]|nr:Extracellular calcium-sensing receptor [Varanus komodoensis]
MERRTWAASQGQERKLKEGDLASDWGLVETPGSRRQAILAVLQPSKHPQERMEENALGRKGRAEAQANPGIVPDDVGNQAMYLILHVTTVVRIAFAQYWMSEEPPTNQLFLKKILECAVMDKLTLSLKEKEDTDFYQTWDSFYHWLEKRDYAEIKLDYSNEALEEEDAAQQASGGGQDGEDVHDHHLLPLRLVFPPTFLPLGKHQLSILKTGCTCWVHGWDVPLSCKELVGNGAGVGQETGLLLHWNSSRNSPGISSKALALCWDQAELGATDYLKILSFLFAIQEINQNPSLLPNITLGYNIYDSLHDVRLTSDAAIDLLTTSQAHVPNYKCGRRDHLLAVHEESNSDNSMQLSNMLSIFKIPQVTYAFTSQVWREKSQSPFFYRMVPEEGTQYPGIVRLLLHFGRRMVGLF